MLKRHAQYPWMRCCARIGAVVVIAAAGGLLACGSSEGGQAFGKGSDGIPSDYGKRIFDAPLESCGLAPIGRGKLLLLASVMPAGFRTPATHWDSVWSPSSVTTVLPLDDGLVVLDQRQSKLSLFNDKLEVVATFGAAGEGPGEFRRASAITHDSVGRILVVDPANGRLTILTRQLRFEGSTAFPVLRSIESIAAAHGDIYASHYIVPEMMVRDPRLREVVGVLHAGTDSTTAMIQLKLGALETDSLLRLPGPNPFRVVTSNGYVLVIAPPIGLVDVFRDGVRLTRLRTCMPEKLDRALSAQLAAYRSGSAPNSQQWNPLVTDAIVVADTIFLVGPLRDASKQLHIDKFRLDGTPIGSLVIPIGNLGFPEDVKFWGSPNRLIAYGPQGTLLGVGIETKE